MTVPEKYYSITYGEKRIAFLLVRRPRKTMAITVYPDLRVEVVAPEGAEIDLILARVSRRSRWIVTQQALFLSWMPKPKKRSYRGGETHRYLGGQYRLSLIKDTQCGVKLRAGFLEVSVPDPADSSAVQKELTKWYRQRAQVRLTEQLEKAHAKMKAYGIAMPRLRLLRMDKRWGSCTPEREVILNPDLIKVPSVCAEYVIVHELCHLRYHNHTAAFFHLLETVLPDWRARKERLELSEI